MAEGERVGKEHPGEGSSGVGGRLRTWRRTCQRWVGSLLLWAGARFSVRARVSKDLQECATEAKRLIDAGLPWLHDDILTWDYEVRSILRRHLEPDHLRRYIRATALGAAKEQKEWSTKAALRRAWREINTSIQAVKKKTFVPTGGLSDAWWFRATVVAFITPAAAAIVGMVTLLIIVPSLPAGNGPSVTTASDPSFGTVQKIVEDPGKVVEVTPTPTPSPPPTPIPTETPTPTPSPSPTPTPTAVLPLPEEPAIDIPPEPEEDQPADEAEDHFVAGVAALEAEDFGGAVNEFSAAIEIEPGFVRAYYNLAVAHASRVTEEDNQAAVENYTKAIELWNSLDSDGDGLLFEAKLARGLLLVSLSTDKQAICLGRSDLLEYLERGDPSQRNTEAVNKALAGIEVACEEVEEIP